MSGSENPWPSIPAAPGVTSKVNKELADTFSVLLTGLDTQAQKIAEAGFSDASVAPFAVNARLVASTVAELALAFEIQPIGNFQQALVASMYRDARRILDIIDVFDKKLMPKDEFVITISNRVADIQEALLPKTDYRYNRLVVVDNPFEYERDPNLPDIKDHVDKAGSEITAPSYVKPSRSGKKGILVYVEPETAAGLKVLAKMHNLSVQKYLAKLIEADVAANRSPEEVAATVKKMLGRFAPR